ncbi:phospholipase A2 [Thermoactinospora rubra]|uniref:phospholipase A2 n=1 Tax=Thermoactinospora rubra TaxID=1088767 RepID=UPI0013020842|nr:phospholipase A2 [Thermoactinospora rubra]
MLIKRIRLLSIGLAAAVTVLPLTIAIPTAAADPAAGTVQQIGPGQFILDDQSFEFAETDVTEGAIGRRHTVTAVAGTLARPESVPSARADLAVFGPGWSAEFLGGATSRSLSVHGDSIVVTEVGLPGSIQYDLKSSAALPMGGGVRKFEAADGGKLTETTRWDSALGALHTTITETPAMDLGAPADGDDSFVKPDGTVAAAADISLTYTWARVTSDAASWRVTGVGNTAHGTATVGYDRLGRVATVTEPAAGETPQSVLTFAYATATTATSAGFGDYAGRVKEISLATGSNAPEVVARYAYDTAGYLRTVTAPSVSLQATYAYDTVGRVSTLSSLSKGGWDLNYAGDSAAPTATPTGPGSLPDAPDSPDSPPSGAPSLADPGAIAPPSTEFQPDGSVSAQAYPSYCSSAATWLWYTKSGCSAWVAHYGWRKPYWRQLPTRRWVVGVLFDHCTRAPDRPAGFDFVAACDMHDYGYGLIGNTYKLYRYYLDRWHKSPVDDLFYVTLRDWTCSAYGARRAYCRAIAWVYRGAVRFGNPKNGAYATR